MTGYRVAQLGAAIDAVVAVPGSKSIANRALVCAALAEGTSRLANVPDGDDTRVLIDALATLGLEIELSGTEVSVTGGRAGLRPGPLTLHCRLAGTTSRFLTALCALGSGPYTIDGEAPLRARPMGPLHDALRVVGAQVDAVAGHLPATVVGPIDPSCEEVPLRGDVSSQYLTAMMLIAPFFDRGLRFVLSTELVSRPYVQMTAAIMQRFGIDHIEVGDRIIAVPPGRYSPQVFAIEPDATSAGYPLAAAAVCGGSVTVPDLTRSSMQGDAGFCFLLERMGCDATQDEAATTVTRSGRLRGVTANMKDMSDLVPTLAVVAAFAEGQTEIHGVGFIRHKESDRISDLCRELARAGVGATPTGDGLVVAPADLHMATLATHHDHRLAMSFAILGLGTSGIVVDDPDVVAKSWPEFWTMLEGLR